VHQTGGANAASSLSSYAKADATGAHFLIDRDGTVVRPPNGKPAEVGVYEVVSPQQNQSLKWLVTELSSTFSIPMTEVFRHPIVSRKNPTEAASALW
jgi:hypothetical protein